MKTHRRGVSLIEVLIVLAIIALAIGMLLPATRNVRGVSERMLCANHLKQLYLGVETYRETQDKSSSNPLHYPTGCIGSGDSPQDRLSWMVSILPYVEENKLYQQFDLKGSYAANQTPAQASLKSFICPSSEQAGTTANTTNYIAIAGLGLNAASQPAGTPGNGFMGYDRITTLDMITDGTSNTIAFLETRAQVGPWARGGTSTVRGVDLQDWPVVGIQQQFGLHDSVAQAAMADGSVRTITSNISAQTIEALVTIHGGDQPAGDW